MTRTLAATAIMFAAVAALAGVAPPTAQAKFQNSTSVAPTDSSAPKPPPAPNPKPDPKCKEKCLEKYRKEKEPICEFQCISQPDPKCKEKCLEQDKKEKEPICEFQCLSR